MLRLSIYVCQGLFANETQTTCYPRGGPSTKTLPSTTPQAPVTIQAADLGPESNYLRGGVSQHFRCIEEEIDGGGPTYVLMRTWSLYILWFLSLLRVRGIRR